MEFVNKEKTKNRKRDEKKGKNEQTSQLCIVSNSYKKVDCH